MSRRIAVSRRPRAAPAAVGPRRPAQNGETTVTLTAGVHPFGRATLLYITIWSMLLTWTELRNFEKYIFWYTTVPLVLLLWRHRRRIPWRGLRCTIIGGGVLALAVVITILNGAEPAYSLLEAGKLAAILLIVAPLLTMGRPLGVALMHGVELSTYVNCVLVLAWVFGGTPTAEVMGPGRFGTVLAGVGTIWRAGAISLVWSTLRYLDGSLLNLRNLLAVAAAAGMFLIDGARTGVLAFGLASLITLIFVFRRKPRFIPLFTAGATVAALLGVWLLGGSAGTAGNGSDDSLRAFRFAAALISREDAADTHDEIREAMLTDVVSEIKSHPFGGKGVGMTQTSIASGDIANHYSYLQMWSDTGFLGFLGYLTAIAGTALKAVLWLSRCDRRLSAEQARAAYAGTFLLLCWTMACSFHAASTEFTEWLMYLAGLSLVSGLICRPWSGPRPRLTARLTLRGAVQRQPCRSSFRQPIDPRPASSKP